MTVDVFGRSLNASASAGPPGKSGHGFTITVDGHYSLEKKRLRNIGTADEPYDAINGVALSQYVKNRSGELMEHFKLLIVALEERLQAEITQLREDVKREVSKSSSKIIEKSTTSLGPLQAQLHKLKKMSSKQP